MSDLDLNPLQNILAEYAPQGQAGLLPALQAAQEVYGFLPERVVVEISHAIDVPLANIYGVIEFYSLLRAQPGGRTVIQVCSDPLCAQAGGDRVLQALRRRLSAAPGATSPDGAFLVEAAPCLGLCAHAPALLAGELPVGGVDPAQVEQILQGGLPAPRTAVGGNPRILTANCGRRGPAGLDAYLASGGYNGLRRALGMAPQVVIDELKASGLVGRGGAAFPTGLKWEGAAAAPGEPKYVVCNADESEPGTFKDRVLLEDDPQRTLEGMAIAAYAIGAQRGYIYVRGEFPQAYASLQEALAEARQAGYLGRDILGSQFSFDIELRRGAGAYICGEETALFESIEGKRGLPRLKPPFPTTHGLFGKPTVINNVETLCNVPFIVEHGAPAYRQMGTQKSPGTKLFCLSGDVNLPGLYEVPFGTSLGELLYDLGGGVPQGRKIGAILMGGAAGSFATEKNLGVRLSFEDLRAAGLALGSGALMVFDESRNLRQALLGIARFFAHESCGKCYPCQMGTRRQYEILQRAARGKALPGDDLRLADVGWTMADASICGLGQTAATAVLSALELWPELFRPDGKNHG